MGKLMKYEWRKTLFSKLILLVITAVAEALFLIGVFFEWENGLGLGMMGLFLCGIFGTIYIGIESLLIFHRDLNTKQSYMMFLTPRNSFQILGAKVLENGLSIFATGLFFAALTAVDFTIGVIHIGGLKELLDMLRQFMEGLANIRLDIPWQELLAFALWMLSDWLLTIVTGYLAIVLSATVLAGNRFSGVVSFVIYLLIMWATSMLLGNLPHPERGMPLFCEMIALALAMVAIMYAVAGWIMERKLSV